MEIDEAYQGEKEIHVQETEDSQGVFPIADLTEYLFGRIDLEELRGKRGRDLYS